MGILRDVDDEAPARGTDEVMDVAPGEPPASTPVARLDPMILGSGRARPLSSLGEGMGTGAANGNGNGTGNGTGKWENVGRNDPCPCGSGRKFKKCHGAAV